MKLALKYLFFSFLISCTNSVSSSAEETNLNTINDTCNDIELGSNLYMEFRDNMTREQFDTKMSTLLQEKIINPVDTSVSIFLPYSQEKPIEIKMRIRAMIEGCYIHEISLFGFPENDYINPSSFQTVISLFESKYGKPYESGYTNLILDDGSEIDGSLGFEVAILELRVGRTIFGFKNIKNGYEKGLAIWNSKGIQITVRYGTHHIYVDYKSLEYIKNKEIQHLKNKQRKDSLTNIKIADSKKSI